MTIRIFVVEDDANKLRNVVTCLKSALTGVPHIIEDARDAIGAKSKLKINQYDLMILDISLPDRAENTPTPLGGIALLEEIIAREGVFRLPQHIIGLTAYSDVREQAALKFEEELWQVIQYEPESENWMDQIRRRVRHIILSARTGAPQSTYETDLCVITALHKPELSAVLNLEWGWQILELEEDSTIYHRGTYKSRRGDGSSSVVAAAAERMGMTAAAILATKMISKFRPKYIAMVGITGGVREKCHLGDVIVADPCWDWGSGRWQSDSKKDSKKRVFVPAPHQISLESWVRGKLMLMANNQADLDSIRSSWNGKKPPHPLQLHLGPAASGAAVLADSFTTDEIKKHHRKLIGVDMEAYGVMAAAQDAGLPAPKYFVIKSVSDFADQKKNDDFQEYASYSSANALRIFVEKYL
jgi:nucleoside phosphorylase